MNDDPALVARVILDTARTTSPAPAPAEAVIS